jgi:hypothetical protein
MRRHRKDQSFPLSQAHEVLRRVAAGDVRPRGVIVTEHRPACGFEIEVASVEEFLRLLKEREDESADQAGRGATRRAIFVAQMMDRRPSNYVFPLIRRYVVAAFAYGSDRVSYTRTTSNAVELPETVEKTRDRQQKAYEELRAEIGRGLRELALRVPIHEGFLRHPADADGSR